MQDDQLCPTLSTIEQLQASAQHRISGMAAAFGWRRVIELLDDAMLLAFVALLIPVVILVIGAPAALLWLLF